MADKMDRKMEEHLMNVQRETKAALDRFEGTGLKVDKKFIDNFLKMSIDRMTQTCRRHETEAKAKVQKPFKIPKPTTITLKPNVSAVFIDLNRPPLVKKKRKSGDVLNVEQAKMPKPIDSNWNAGEKALAINGSQIRYTVFYCVHCMNMDDFSKSFNGTIDKVYGHWLSAHANESISKPFQFYALTSAKCFYCDEVGTYNDQVKHHQEVHLSRDFAVVDPMDPTKCGICHWKDGDLVDHFNKSHITIAASKVFNPIHYTEDRIAELLSINVTKEPQCVLCMHIYETQTDLLEHYAISHDGHVAANDLGNQDQPSYLICGYCQKKVDRNWYINHFKAHVYNFKCSECEHLSVNLAEMIIHEKNAHGLNSLDYHSTQFPNWLENQYVNTSLVFDNGLILQNQNVFGTQYDSSMLLNAYIYESLDLTKERVQQKIGTQQKSSTQAKATSTYDPLLMKELEDQRKLIINLYIGGTPHKLNDGLHEIFQRLCQILEVNVSQDDVKEIFQCNNGIIVKLQRIELKETILNRMQNKNIWLSHLVELSEDQKPRKIQVYNQLTNFYREIWMTATKYKEQGSLHSFKLSGSGVVVRRNAPDVEHVVQSKKQLIDFVERK